MKFSQLRPGMVLKAGPVLVTKEDILAFSRSFDPQRFLLDSDRAEHGRWGGLIASGWHTCALASRMMAEAVFHDSEAVGSPGLCEIRWRVPVRPGDTLRMQAQVLAVMPSASEEEIGIVKWVWAVSNQRDEWVLELEATSLFDLSDSGDDAATR